MMIICSANAKMLFLPHTPLNQASRRPPGEVLGTNTKTASTATTVRRTASRNGSGMSRSTYRTHAFVKRFIGSPGRHGWSVTARDAAGGCYPRRGRPNRPGPPCRARRGTRRARPESGRGAGQEHGEQVGRSARQGQLAPVPLGAPADGERVLGEQRVQSGAVHPASDDEAARGRHQPPPGEEAAGLALPLEVRDVVGTQRVDLREG